MDPLSEILRSVSIDAAAFADVRLAAPWRLEFPPAAVLRDALCPGAGHLLLCHFVVEGECVVTSGGAPPLAVKAADAVVIARGDAHAIASSAHVDSCDSINALDLLRSPLRTPSLGGDGPVSARLICGYMACDPWVSAMIFDVLPRAVVTSLRHQTPWDWLEGAVRHAAREATSSRPGGRSVLAKLAELVLVEMLRRHLEATQEESGWLGGLRDPVVGRSLAALHREPAHPWTLADLARTVGASRSVLAERFQRTVGQPPMQYLTKWRMALAARHLQRTSLSLIRIAEEVGYDTGTAFNRAFAREFGLPPARWRRHMASAGHAGCSGESA